MNQISERLASLSPSETLAMSQKSNELKAQGIDIINLSVGEPDFNTPIILKPQQKKRLMIIFRSILRFPDIWICVKLYVRN